MYTGFSQSELSRQEVAPRELPLVPGPDGQIRRTNAPRYARPNIASILPEYANAEQDLINRAFATGNYDSLHRLPDTIKADEVTRKRRMQMEDVRNNASAVVSPGFGSIPKPTAKHGLFQDFDWLPSPYSLADDIASEERERSKEIELQVGRGQFYLPAGAVKKEKNEELFVERDFFKHSSDWYDALREKNLRERWLKDSKILFGPFVPPSHLHNARPDIYTRASAQEITARVAALLTSDWPESKVEVYLNAEGLVVVRFKLDTVNSTQLTEMKLRKSVDHWNATPGDGHIYFTLHPPWLRQAAEQTFYTLHPEEATYSGPRK